MVPSAFAANCEENSITNRDDIYLQEIADGNIFIQQANNKLVAIVTSNTEHAIAISIKYLPESDVVYQWIITDYPEAEFCPNDLSFWADIIDFAEGKMNQASLVTFSFEEVDANDPMIISSAGADLAEDLESIVGSEYSDKYAGQTRLMDGHYYRLYETLEFYIQKAGTVSWNDGITLASLAVGIIGVVATNPTISLICGILGLISTGATMVIPAGKMNKYECMAFYTRYVTVDYSERQYSYAYKVRNFTGYEDASNNSTGRAHIIPATEVVYYSGTMTEEYYNGGLFDEAYKAYNNL